MAPLVWLVTGTTSGIGRALVDQIISRGDKIIAAGRKVEQRLGSIKSDSVALLELDVAAGREVITAKINEAWNIFGHIDILLNNAGMSAIRSAEESDDAYINTMFTVNLFGQMHITSAILPLLRARAAAGKPARIGFTSSSTAWAPLPFMSHYAASKAALSAYVEGLHKELKPLGIQCVAFECGGCLTHLGQPREEKPAAAAATTTGEESGGALKAYEKGFADLMGMFGSDPMAFMPGDAARVAERMVAVVTMGLGVEGGVTGKKWAVRVVLGSDAYDHVRQKCEEMLKLTEEWKYLSYSTDRDGYGGVTQRSYLDMVSILE
ncbi:hypothetical protein B0T17DRAFT_589939 [Bombardia bombarda]|uniref:Uncharacterized protein n=1 Tax=Bombardia bombarda TaxID=252184 RepID=A0AA39XB09_9PEZI|nr:hypothetical protein B0T17DRAFT_589939 [Bombardia bombarda]